jgi:hypothetical protein
MLVDLINSKAFQRLKLISQQGVPADFLPKTTPAYSRYEHSIGVMAILRKLGASPEEQAAGLLHDVSHTAFSHIIDYVISSGANEEYQDSNHKRFFLLGSELANILEKHSLDPKRVSNLEIYGLLERHQPELCADRLDYTLRYHAHNGDMAFVKRCIESITASAGVTVFSSLDPAREFAERHLATWNASRGGYAEKGWDMAVRWYLFSSALKIALSKNIITMGDFKQNDDYVMGMLNKAGDAAIVKILELLKNNMEFTLSEDNPKVEIRFKFRYVDPLFIEGDSVKRVSEADPDFKRLLNDAIAINGHGCVLKLGSIKGIELPIES